MSTPLDNPVYHALCTGNASHALGSGAVKYFDEEVSPFAGFALENASGFRELHQLFKPGRRILFASRKQTPTPPGWILKHYVHGAQFLYASHKGFQADFSDIVPLTAQHVSEMVVLATLTRPGPFATRTIEFGGYHGIFQHGKLVSMTGRRLHVYDHLELSAVCTHPNYVGKGYAGRLMMHQVNSILAENKIPFLHVRADNAGAIGLYEKLGFAANGPMHFYFMERGEG